MKGKLVWVLGIVAVVILSAIGSLLIPLISAVAAIALVLASKAEKPRLAHIAVGCIAIVALWQSKVAYDDFRDDRRQTRAVEEQRRWMTNEVTISVVQFVAIIETMIHHASDGWLPANYREFFSPEATDLVCLHLDLSATAPVKPEQTWRGWISTESGRFQEELRATLESRASVLEPELITLLSRAENSVLLAIWPNLVRLDRISLDSSSSAGIRRPCYGPIKDEMAKSLTDLGGLYDWLDNERHRSGVEHDHPWDKFAREDYRNSVGGSRI